MNVRSMKDDQKIVLIYSIIAIVSGLISGYFIIGDLLYSLSIPILIYGLTTFILSRVMPNIKKSVLISNSVVTFLPVWIVIWTFLYNL